jgi:maltose O-acetyltransferase
MKYDIDINASIFMHCSFDCSGGLIVGKYSTVNSRCRLDTRGDIHIGENVSISSEVIILTADHDLSKITFEGRNRPVVINDFVWIGTRAVILPGVNIGKGAIIAACALVTKDVAPFSVVAGVPGKVIKMRPEENLQYAAYYKRLFQ